MDDDEFLYGSAEDRDAQQTETTIEAKDGAELEPAQKAAIEESSSEESDSDSDVEFIIGSSESKAVALDDKTKEQPTPGPEQTSVPIFTQTTGLDINQVASYEGQPITQLSLEELKEKPWRLPGADISDYFNYGFDELSWLAYCSKQDKLRAEFNPSKLINDLIASGSIPPSLSGLLGGMPGANGQTPMPPPFMMGMPPFMAMPNMFGQKKDGAQQQQQGSKLPSRPASNSTPEPGNKSGRVQGSQRDQADRDFETGSHQQSYRDRDERGGGGRRRRR